MGQNKRTFDNSPYYRQDSYLKLVEAFEGLADDTTVPVAHRDRIVKGLMQGFFYPDANCPDCLGEVGRGKPRRALPSVNYPYRVEADADGDLVATYECRNCCFIYQVGYTRDFRMLQFG